MLKLKILFFFSLLFAGRLMAGDETRSMRAYANQLVPGAFIQTHDDKFTNTAGSVGAFTNFANRGVVELGLDEDKHTIMAAKKICAKFDVAITDANLVTTIYTNQQLDINYNPFEQTRYKDKAQIVYPNAYKIKVYNLVINSCNISTSNCSQCTTSVYTGNDVYVQAEITTTRIYNFNFTSTFAPGDLASSVNATTQEMEIDWNYITGAEEYELEYTYIDNYSGTLGSPLAATALNYDLEHDATRISTTQNYYRVPLTYENGYIVYRIRPVGKSTLNQRIDGTWAGAPANGAVSAAGIFVQPVTALNSDALSWQSTKTFAENGKTGTGVSFSDALGYKRQSLARLNTDQKTIAQSTLYDFYGRPVINILPSPVSGLDFNYRFNLNKYLNSAIPPAVVEFEKHGFDLNLASNICAGNSVALDLSSAGATKYYSSQNPNKDGFQGYVPDAGRLPYSQVTLKPDGLGRVTAQTMPGPTHQLGSGKEIKYYYSKPTQVELDRLFGSEAPRAIHCFKNYVLDPNGQMSATYIDQYGRTMATALLGNSPFNVDQLPNLPTSQIFTDSLQVIPTNHKDTADKCIDVNTTFFVVDANTPMNWLYKTTLGQFGSSCTPNLCFNCVYDLSIHITDDCGQEVFDYGSGILGYDNTIPSAPYAAVACTGTTQIQVTGATLNMPIVIYFSRPGTYTVMKKICVSDAPMNDYAQAFKNNQTCVDPCHFVDSLIAAADFSGCGAQTCQQCLTSISNYTNMSANPAYRAKFDEKGNLIDSTYKGPIYPPLTPDQLSKMLENCADLCGPNTVCEKYERMLMADFYPATGQFAITNTLDARWAGSVMNTSNTLFSGYNFTSPVNYLSANGSYDQVQINGSNVFPQSLTSAQYIQYYKKSWARAFLNQHPENCKYYFYCNVIGGSLQYDEDLKNVAHYDTACASTGFVFPLGSLPGTVVSPPASTCATTADPLLTSLSGNALVTSFKNELLTNLYTNTSQSIYDFVTGKFYSSVPSGYKFAQDECNRDAMWSMFKSIYLAKKYALYQALLSSYMSNPSAFGYSGSCAANVPSGYTSHFPNLMDSVDKYLPGSPSTKTQMNAMLATNSQAAAYAVGANITAANAATMAANSASTCAGYVTLWNQNLNTACPAYSSASTLVKNNIMTALQGVCAKGCDINNPLGGSTVPTGNGYIIMPANVTVNSFQEVLDYYLGNNACNALVISQPPPYPYNAGAQSPASGHKLGSCHCDQILQVSATYQTMKTNNTLPAGVTEEWQMFRKLYGYDLKEYYALKCFCNNAVASDASNSPWTSGLVWSNTQVNAVASYPLSVDPNFGCSACLKCTDVSTAIDNLALPNTTAYTSKLDKIQNDSTNTYYTLALLNNQFGKHTLKFYFDLYTDCKRFGRTNADTAYTFANNISSQALDLFNYLDELVKSSNLQKNNRPLSICQDDKYYLSGLYTGTLPTINALTYNSTILGNVLTFTIQNSSAAVLSISLTLPSSYTGGWSSLLYLQNFAAYCPSPAGGPNYGFKVDATTNAFTNITITGQVTNLAFPISNLSSGANPVPVVCPEKPKTKNNCATTTINNALVQGRVLYNQQLDNLVATFINDYRQSCFNAVQETFYRNYTFVKEYDYTLYYYDEAGNLQRTVAPNGVVPLSITTNINPAAAPTYPLHSSSANGVNLQYVSDYRFNAYNQPVKEITVDGGETNYLYDYIGRIIASQNAKQAAVAGGNVYSYTLYDAIGRIGEVGEMTTSTNLFATAGVNSMAYNTFTAVVAATSTTRKQVNRTYYDDFSNITASTNAPFYFALSGNSLSNLRNRVACVTFAEDPTANVYDHASFYSYDDHGNVSFVVQENNVLPGQLSGPVSSYNMQFKRIDYSYDLISGNMLKATYQASQPDQFMHKYYYDADNRLHEVFSSKDDVNWDRDAKYFYYEHGPLARIERADKQVQGEDFYYTIHGWLKGVNSDIMQPNNDAGKDGAATTAYLSNYNRIHGYFAKDAMAFALNYYHNTSGTIPAIDYTAIKATNFTSTANDLDPSSSLANLYATNSSFYLDNNAGAGDGPSLYNGNISSMVTGFIDKDVSNTITDNTPFPQLTAYRYDQLHRITAMKAHRSLTGNVWNTAVAASNYDDSYRMNFSYDNNGNLLTLFRNGAAPSGPGLKPGATLAMDNLAYKYKTVANTAAVNANQLYGISDAATTSTYLDDVDGPTSVGAYTGSSDRYAYDQVGNLKKDAGEYIALIKWTVDRKVKRIMRDSTAMYAMGTGANAVTKPDIEYEYNAMRQRVTKIIKPRDPGTKMLTNPRDWQYTYYVYDAGGNVMAVYNRGVTLNNTTYTDAVKLAENHLYGSSRLALSRPANDSAMWSYKFSACGAPGGVVDCRTASGIVSPAIFNPLPYYKTGRNLGYKEFELNNHLGNVIATVSDRKIVLTACPNQFLHPFDDGNTGGLGSVNVSTVIIGGVFKVTPIAPHPAINFTYAAAAGDLMNISFDLGMGNSTAADSLSATAYLYDGHTVGPVFAKTYMPNDGTYNVPFTGPAAGGTYNSMYFEFTSKTGTVSPHYFTLDNLAIGIATGGIPSGGSCSGYANLFIGYFPDLLMHTDYYAFGQQMPGRQWVFSDYRYGMNGQEKQDELFKGANSAEYWMYDSRIGRRFEIDPVRKEWESPYATFANNPIYHADPNGLDPTTPAKPAPKSKGGSDLKNGGINGVKPVMPGEKSADPEFPMNKDGKAIELEAVEVSATKIDKPNIFQRIGVAFAGLMRKLDNIVATIKHDATNIIKGNFMIWGSSGSGDGIKHKEDVIKIKGPIGPMMDVGGFMDKFQYYKVKPLGGEGEEGRDRAKEQGHDENVEGLPEAVDNLKRDEPKTAIRRATIDTITQDVKKNGDVTYTVYTTYDKAAYDSTAGAIKPKDMKMKDSKGSVTNFDINK